MGISKENVAAILGILRSGLYTDKIGAVLREYGANAWDANRMVGRGDLPITVHIPTSHDPVLRIRDNGPGLSKSDVLNVFSQYGASTKRATNDAVGCLGIGAKSGFAYADAFTVISWPGDGTRLTYSVFLDETEMGQMNLMDESPSDEPTGVQIEITARHSDIYEFTQKAQKLFQHYEPRPNINITLPAVPDKRVALVNGTIQDAGGWSSSWFAIMGCVPYRVDLEQLDQTLIAKCLPRLSGSVRFEIGDVAIASNREELQYSTKTKATLVQKLNDLVDEYVIHALEKLEGMTGWDKRLKLKVLEEMGLDLPSEYEEMMDTYASIKYEPGVAGFTILHNDSVCTRITVSSKTKFVIKDTDFPLKHYPHLNHHYYIVKGPGTPEDVKKKLEDALKQSNLDGVPVGLLSAEHYQKPWEKPKKVVNPKHRAKMFRLDIGKCAHSTNSENWEVVDRVPEDTDVIVIIKSFEPEIRNFWTNIVQLKAFCAQSGETMPEIYGYKSTEKKPVLATDCKGMEFSAWYRDTTAKWTVKYADKLQEYWWTYPAERLSDPGAYGRKWLAEQLGEDHVISNFFKKFTKGDVKTLSAFQFLADQSETWKTSEAKTTMDRFFQQYPLLKNDVSDLWDAYNYGNQATRENWVAYVKQTDELQLLRSALASDDLDPCI